MSCVPLDRSVRDVIIWQCANRQYGGEKRWREEGRAKKWKNKHDRGDDWSHGEREMSQVESRCRVSAAIIRFPPARSASHQALQPGSSIRTTARTRPERPELHFCSPSGSQGRGSWTTCRTFTRDHPESVCGSVRATESGRSSQVTADFCYEFTLSTEALRDKWELFSHLFMTSEQVKDVQYVLKLWNRTKENKLFYSEVETKVWFSSVASHFFFFIGETKSPSFIKNLDKTLFFPNAFKDKKINKCRKKAIIFICTNKFGRWFSFFNCEKTPSSRGKRWWES